MSSIFVYYDPVTELYRLFEGALAARSCPRALSTRISQAATRHRDVYRPRVNIHESKDANTVTAAFELPGLTSDDVAIEIGQDVLTVSGDSSHAETSGSDSQRGAEESAYTVRERHSGKFSRTLRLPVGTKPEDVKAKMENGILRVTFPRTLPDQSPTRISIQ